MSFNDNTDYKVKYDAISEELERALDFIREIQGEKKKLKEKIKKLKFQISNLCEISRYLLRDK